MKKLDWLLLFTSALLYALPFLFSEYLWWLVFVFPIPLLYLTRTTNLSFIHGYLWGCVVFVLHLSGGIYVMVNMAHGSWPIGVALGVAIVLYQALCPAFFFWGAAKTVAVFSVQSLIVRLCIWTIALLCFIVWVDWYSMWIFGIQEGYPLMHPLIPLAQKPALLCCLPIIGKQMLTGLFLLVPASCVLVLWYKNYWALLFCCSAIISWLIFCLVGESAIQHVDWQNKIKSLPYMACSTAKNPIVIFKVVGNQLKNIIAQYPETNIIIMPESAFNVSNFAELPELIQLWSGNHLGKAVHLIFGASRWHNGNYYNSLHWVYDGVLQDCCDKRHAMLISERLSWMNCILMQQVYFSQGSPVAISSCERIKLFLGENGEFAPYICSELFCNEWPDDNYKNTPIMVLVNDSIFISSSCSAYIQKLLVLLAQLKAIQWQRDIIYVSYAQSLFIDRWGGCKEMNE